MGGDNHEKIRTRAAIYVGWGRGGVGEGVRRGTTRGCCTTPRPRPSRSPCAALRLWHAAVPGGTGYSTTRPAEQERGQPRPSGSESPQAGRAPRRGSASEAAAAAGPRVSPRHPPEQTGGRRPGADWRPAVRSRLAAGQARPRTPPPKPPPPPAPAPSPRPGPGAVWPGEAGVTLWGQVQDNMRSWRARMRFKKAIIATVATARPPPPPRPLVACDARSARRAAQLLMYGPKKL